MRKRISERNIFPSFDIKKEYDKIQILFCKEGEFGYVHDRGIYHASLTYKSILEINFLSWNLRGTFISLSEMLDDLEISDKYFKREPSEDRFLDYIQFIVNAVCFVDKLVEEKSLTYYRQGVTVENAIISNISLIADYFDTEFAKGENGELFVSYKNDISSVIANNFPDLRGSIVEYQKIDNRKGELLCTFAKILKKYERLINGTEFKSICSDTTMLMNNAGVRHCINQNNKIGVKFYSMSDEDKLKWYDRAFEMFIACMAVVPYLKYKDELKSIRKD